MIQPPVYNQTGSESQYNFVYNLAPEAQILLFWNFTPIIESPYFITITTLLDIDINSANNQTSGICYVQSTFWTWNDIPNGDDGTSFDLWDNGAGTVWEWGIPQVPGPSSAHEGANSWGTDLNAAYVDNTGCMLYTRSFDFTAATSVTISFWHWYDIHGSGGSPNRDCRIRFRFRMDYNQRSYRKFYFGDILSTAEFHWIPDLCNSRRLQ